ncbi:hypothetical protein AURDEDRAFT_182656 [Auricularia subglabra TFB-10046 SS5]|nr:hypothetical protein AURDEDRAFT_182656 [Auricularia subglabra TFB-10046 SS5]
MMQLKTSMLMLATLCTVSASAHVVDARALANNTDPAPPSVAPSAEPPETPAPGPLAPRATCGRRDGQWCIDGFGGRTPGHGSGIGYVGNVGNPWGSNIITVDASIADQYKYTVKFVGSGNMGQPYRVVAWNKIGPDGGLNGWYGNSAVSFSLAPGGVQYVAFDENSQGGFGAAPGNALPKDQFGGYDCTWGEFDFGSGVNSGWSGFDVSMIQAQAAGAHVQGMRMCDVTSGAQGVCSTITTNAGRVDNAYTQANAGVGGIGGNLFPGKVRIETVVEYNG